MIPFGPWSELSVMNAAPASPRRRSKRTSLRQVVGSATSVGEQDRLRHRVAVGGVPGQVAADELGAAVLGRCEHRAAGVEQPQAVGRVDDDALHRHHPLGVGVAARVVALGVREGDGLAVAQRSGR
jgi:hypothetical protein